MIEVKCPLCGKALKFSVASSRKAKNKKSFVMLVCPEDARHFRAFISYQPFVLDLVRKGLDQKAEAETGTGTGTGRVDPGAEGGNYLRQTERGGGG